MLAISVSITLANASLDAVSEKIRENIMTYIDSLKSDWMNQVPNRNSSASIVIREAFIYAAALVPGVVDVTDVKLYKDGALMPQSASWITNTSTMEWIRDSSVAININQN